MIDIWSLFLIQVGFKIERVMEDYVRVSKVIENPKEA